MIVTLAAILGGLVLLVLGAEALIRGATRLAEGFGVSPLLIGLTVVGFGTSTPELVTSVQGAIAGSPGIAVGNIVGSNIFNILVILGLSALIQPLAVSASALKRDAGIVIATALLLTGIGLVWTLDRVTGAVFLAGLAADLVYAWRQERTPAPAAGHTAAYDKAEAAEGLDPGLRPRAGVAPSPLRWVKALAFAVAGLALLVTGSRFFVGGAIDLAQALDISETVIGLTIVAAGTSMPELATSALAAMRRQADVAIGNILGSNIYNILGIGGVTAILSPTPVPETIAGFDNFVMLAVSVVLLAMLWTGRRLSRIEGAILFAGYLAYVWAIWP
ncbi:calcium/sodium antiporter [Marinicauda algicola]|uniref:Calcium/sodium antiporter n=1 Tax=Marinicauda algicola TaxID=2029849 RepID=A0A4S2H4M9_9PROT|nr:calcium/sodium antiporter [Marinicauda algicola]TGY90378.1 calcium/sodium antiporter [Marinicauda algicola]